MRYPTSTECDTQPVQSAFANPVNSRSVASKKVKVFTTVFRRKNRLSGADARGASRVFQPKRSFLMFPLPRSLYPLIFSTLYPFHLSFFVPRASVICSYPVRAPFPVSRNGERGWCCFDAPASCVAWSAPRLARVAPMHLTNGNTGLG